MTAAVRKRNMAITPKDTFDAALSRAQHLLVLYDILHDSRQRSIRADWKKAFCKCMHWPISEEIVRIDGKDKNSILILKDNLGLSRKEFTHEYLSELLRSIITASVSALDKFIHDQIVSNSLKLLSRPEDDIPKKLKNLKISALTFKRSLEKLRSESSSRPGSILKKDLQDMLHRDETFQSVSGVEKGAQMLGIQDFWGEMSNRMTGYPSAGAVQEGLRKITKRRNQIVHEADVIPQQKAHRVKLRDISVADATHALDFISDFVTQFDVLVEENC